MIKLKFKNYWIYRLLCFGLIVVFSLSSFPTYALGQSVGIGGGITTSGALVPLSAAFTPTLIRGIRVYPDNPFQFDFIVDSGDIVLQGDELKKESEKLVRYFLASLTLPENDLWVNLSPHEKDRIVPKELGNTEMGIDMLAQDYLLKQVTASLLYPESDLGKSFWSNVYKKAYELYGTTEIPINTFNKVWILPDKAVVYEDGDKAFIIESRLKVMLEEDYLALKNNLKSEERGIADLPAKDATELNNISSKVVKELILPEIEKEINEGKNFSQLRQIYNSIILSCWYKKNLKNSILNKVYSDKKKVEGLRMTLRDDKDLNDEGSELDVNGLSSVEQIYSKYLNTFKKGVYNIIKDEYDPYAKEVVSRKYFSGGVVWKLDHAMTTTQSPSAGRAFIKILKKAGLISLVTISLVAVGSYTYLRYGRNFSLSYMFKRPEPALNVTYETAQTISSNGDTLDVFPLIQGVERKVKEAIEKGSADSIFWRNVFSDYPEEAPVSAIITLDNIKKVYESGQLNDLFNTLRFFPELTYRYFIEITEEHHDDFSRYFAVLNPAIRQVILDIIYHRLGNDFYVLENGELVKSFLTPRSYLDLYIQAYRLKHLYEKLYQRLNKIVPRDIGDIPEGPLWIHELPQGEPDAPYVNISFTRQQSIENIYQTFFDVVIMYKDLGYTVAMPKIENVNLSEVATLISTEVSKYEETKNISFFENNQASRLLKWVDDMTNPSNPKAHRVTEQEILAKAMELHIDKESKTIDLFSVIATISHYYKTMARSPEYVLGGVEVRSSEDGTDYMWNHHDPGWLFWSLDPDKVRSVDDQGRPVMHWRIVTSDGRDSIPSTQRTGILRFGTEDNQYHSWAMLLFSIYAAQKSLGETKDDYRSFVKDENLQERGLTKYNYIGISDLLGVGKNLFSERGTWFGTSDIIRLPVFFKYIQNMGLEDFAWGDPDFGNGNTSDEKLSRSIFASVGELIAENLVAKREIVEQRDINIRLVRTPTTRTILGGRDLNEYFKGLIDERNRLMKYPSVSNIQRLGEISAEIDVHSSYNNFTDLPDITFQKYVDLVFDVDQKLSEDDKRIISNFPFDVKRKFAMHTSSEKVLRYFYDDPKLLTIIDNLLINPNIPKDLNLRFILVDILNEIQFNPDKWIEANVRYDAPRSILESIAQDRYESVVVHIKENMHLPIGFLLQILKKAHDRGRDDIVSQMTEDLKSVKGGIGEHIVKIYQLWDKSDKKVIPQEAVDLMLTAEVDFQKIIADDFTSSWSHVPVTGDIVRDTKEFVQAIRSKNGSVNISTPSGVEAAQDSMMKSLLSPSIQSDSDNVGGIDFNVQNMNVEAKGSLAVNLNLEDNIRDENLMNMEGLTPIIINILPVSDFVGLLDLQGKEDQQDLTPI